MTLNMFFGVFVGFDFFVFFSIVFFAFFFVNFGLGRSTLLVGLNLFQILALHVMKEVTACAQVGDALGGW